jgi:hypothetical protein
MKVSWANVILSLTKLCRFDEFVFSVTTTAATSASYEEIFFNQHVLFATEYSSTI